MLPGVPRDVICENPAVPRGTLTVGGRMLAVETIGNDRLARGDVAQLVERLLCKQDVRSSNLLVSTKTVRVVAVTMGGGRVPFRIVTRWRQF